MRLRKLVSIVLITAMLFFAPSMIPARDVPGPIPCSIPSGWLPTDTAFAGPGIVIPCPVAPTSTRHHGMVLGLVCLPSLYHPLRHCRQFPRQPATDRSRGMELRVAVLVREAEDCAGQQPSLAY